MSLKDIKDEWHHYYLNDANQIHGEYKTYWNNGQLWLNCHYNNGDYHGEYKLHHRNGLSWVHCHYTNGKLHGEFKRNDSNGRLEYHTYDVNGEEVHNFLEEDSEFIRACLYIKYGAPWLGGSDVT